METTSKTPNHIAAKRPKLLLSKFEVRKAALLRDVEAAYTKIQQVGQGTYGSVFMGKDKVTHEVVALKRINTKQEENGFPITALREVKILKALDSDHIVKLKEIVTSKEKPSSAAGADNENGISRRSDKNFTVPRNVFMVFEYLEYDLTGILETHEIRLTQDHIKSWAFQLLTGVHYMHMQNILHRDLKAANLLVSRNGVLKIADWGLARSWSKDMKRLTNLVITLWYRPPELLLGCNQYSGKIDMWSVGCIIAEMFRRAGFLKGKTEQHQLDLIFQTCGLPNMKDWPEVHRMCPLWKNYEPQMEERSLKYVNRLKETLTQQLPNRAWLTDNAIGLIGKLLTLNPGKRASAEDALDSSYFYDNPRVKKAEELNMNFSVSSVHEWEARKRQQEDIENRRAKQSKQISSAQSYKAKVKPMTKPPPPPPLPPSKRRPPPPK